MSKSERTQVLLTPLQRAKAERIARREGTSIGAVVRDALDGYQVGRGTAERRDAIDTLIAMSAPVEDWPAMKADLIETRFDRVDNGIA
jgi:hypothetical protein